MEIRRILKENFYKYYKDRLAWLDCDEVSMYEN